MLRIIPVSTFSPSLFNSRHGIQYQPFVDSSVQTGFRLGIKKKMTEDKGFYDSSSLPPFNIRSDLVMDLHVIFFLETLSDNWFR